MRIRSSTRSASQRTRSPFRVELALGAFLSLAASRTGESQAFAQAPHGDETTDDALKAARSRDEEPFPPANSSTLAAGAELHPAGTPGSTISSEEAEPPSPPSATDLDGPKTPDDLLRDQIKDLEYYTKGGVSFEGDMRDLVKIRYDQQREVLAAQYEAQLMGLERAEREGRLEAITRFEEFVRKYPNDPSYTPDAIFRLAELYFEASSDDYLARSRQYEKDLQSFERGKIPTEPVAPEPRYEKTIGLYHDLLTRFPDYRLADAARYLLGYCYSEQNQSKEALAMFLEVVQKHPDSRFSAEVLTRVGEIYFDSSEPDSLEKAIEMYSRVRQYPDSPYYDKALYKIAWTYYRLDRFDDAVKNFIELVSYADEQKKVTGKSGSELRNEAIQYVAISLADEGWGGVERAKQVLRPHESQPYAGELWKRYGDVLFDQTRYPLAIEVMKHAVEEYPNAPHSPEVQAKIVAAYERQRDFDGATVAREELVSKYGENSAWYRANQGDREAIARAAELTERSLYTAAIFHHQQAQAHKNAGRTEDARRSYLTAGVAYEKYLGRFPDSRNAYDLQFFLAECLYYSLDYDRAAERYALVRDSNADNKHLEAAALSAVLTYEKAIERQEAENKLQALPLLTSAERKGQTLAPREIAPLRLKLVNASDRFVTLLPTSERAPAIAYRAAEIFYKHDQMEEARKRFEQIIALHPGVDVARYSSNLIIESYLAGSDYENVEKWSQRLIDLSQAAPKPAAGSDDKARQEFVENLKTFKVGAQFKRAEQFDADGNFEAAANTYAQLVDENPKHEFADKALYNAAVAYEKVKRFDTASKVYQRIYDDYPKSGLADRALFRVGVNAEKGYDFQNAITAYGQLVERYPKSEHRADALYNVAVTLENMQQYGQAAEAYKKYAQAFPDREDSGANYFRAALVYEKMEAWKDMIDTLQAFVRKYGRDSRQKEQIVEAHEKMGDAQKARKDERAAFASYRACASEFSKRGLSMTSKAAANAANCSFQIAENQFREYDEIKIRGTGKKQINALAEKAKMQRAVERSYTDIFKYKRVETTLAASYRIGHSYERFAEAMFAAEVPPEFKGKAELEDEYKAQLEEKAAVLERKAEEAYRKAYAEAKRTRVTNEWTQRILEGLNKYQPQDFPIQKRGKALMQRETITGNGLDTLRTPGAGGNQPQTANAVGSN